MGKEIIKETNVSFILKAEMKNALEKIKSNKSLLLFIGLITISFILRIVGFADSYKTPMSVFVILCSSVICYLEIKKQKYTKLEFTLIIISYFLHIFVMLIDVYYTPVLFNGGDCDNFFDTAVKFYNGDFTTRFTYYPYFIYFLFLFFGANRVIVQYSNVIFWIINIIIINKICYKLEIKNLAKTFVIFVACLQPIYLCFMSLLLRDCIISTSIIYSFYKLIKWKETGNDKEVLLAILATLIGTVLHVGALAITAAIVLNVALYDKYSTKLKIQKKTFVILILFTAVGITCFMIPKIRDGVLEYIPSINNFNLIEYYKTSAIYRKAGFIGGSDYLMSDDIKNYFELLIVSIRRVYYFYFSPMPTYWRGIKDVLSFLIDSSIYLLAIILLIISRIKNNWDNVKTTITLYLLCFGLFFMWGVSNAGTAMRHRDKVFLIIVGTIGYCLKDKISKIGERK